jgi:biopolymer transport protein TolQ
LRAPIRPYQKGKNGLSSILCSAPLLEVNIWEMVKTTEPIPLAVLGILVIFSLLSWTIIFSKWAAFRRAQRQNRAFLNAFRKSGRLDTAAAVVEQFKGAPLAGMFAFGYSEVARQVTARHTVTNKAALERTLQLGASEEITQLERNMNWLATTAAVCPFIGLFGTVWGIIDAFQALSLTASTSMRTVGPGIGHALVATAMGLAAAIPAAVFYNHFGHIIKEIGQRMEDFALEFMNVTERTFEERL